MNNWDTNKPAITVVYGAPDVPDSALGVVLSDMYMGMAWESGIVDNTEGMVGGLRFHVVEDSPNGIADEHLQEVINCLNDHINNTKTEDWLVHQHDLLVDDKEWLWVNVAWGTYYGPNCKVEVHYVTI